MMTIDKIDSSQILRMDAAWVAPNLLIAPASARQSWPIFRKEIWRNILRTKNFRRIRQIIVTSKKVLKEELLQSWKKGYSIDNEEFTIGLKYNGAPIFNYEGQAQFTLSISGPAIPFDNKRIYAMQRELRIISSCLSEKLGYSLNAA